MTETFLLQIFGGPRFRSRDYCLNSAGRATTAFVGKWWKVEGLMEMLVICLSDLTTETFIITLILGSIVLRVFEQN